MPVGAPRSGGHRGTVRRVSAGSSVWRFPWNEEQIRTKPINLPDRSVGQKAEIVLLCSADEHCRNRPVWGGPPVRCDDGGPREPRRAPVWQMRPHANFWKNSRLGGFVVPWDRVMAVREVAPFFWRIGNWQMANVLS